MDSRAVEEHLGGYFGDSEDGLLRTAGSAEDELVDEAEVERGWIRSVYHSERG